MIEPPDSIPSVVRQMPSVHPQPVRVLLLDDEPTNLHLRTAILRQHGYECIPASSIEEATELFNKIDIAVLDYHLGAGQFGTEVAALLRRRRPHVPIIILSATLAPSATVTTAREPAVTLRSPASSFHRRS